MLQQQYRILAVIVLLMIRLSQEKLYSQNVDSTLKVQMSILQTDEQTDNATIEELATTIEELSRNPIDLNNADKSELEKLTMLNDFQISSLWNYLEKHRPVLTVYELQTVMGFDSKDVEAVKRFVTCKPVEKEKKFEIRNRVTVLEQYGESMIEDSVVSNPNYQGKPTKTLTRWQSDIGEHVRLSATAEKDPYEHFGKQGFDFYSGSIAIVKKRYLKKVILGDYSMHFGQGLVAWNGYSFRNLTDIRKRSEGLIPYKSLDENQFYRGAAVTLGNKQWDCSFIVSSHLIDGSVDTVNNTVTSLQKTGYHRTLSEIAGKHSVRFSSVGGNVNYKFSKGMLGFTHITHLFDKPMLPSNKAYNMYAFSGKQMSMSGINVFLNFKQADLFGEAAVTELLHKAIVCGGEFQLTGFLQFSMLYRNYHPGYYSFMNSGFSSGSKTSNEQGFYWALRSQIDTVNSIMASVDLYKHPWLQYGMYDVSTGSVTAITYERKLTNTGKILVQYKYYSKPSNDTTTNLQVKTVSQFQENRVKAALYLQLGEQWRFVTQGVCAFASLTSSPSVFLSQDVDYYYTDKFSLSLRYAVFEATYDSRISVYESDVRVGTSAAFFGEGDKFYIKANYHLGKNLQFSAKYACLNKVTAKVYSSKNEYSVLVKWLF